MQTAHVETLCTTLHTQGQADWRFHIGQAKPQLGEHNDIHMDNIHAFQCLGNVAPVCVYIYIHIYTHTYIYVYVYIHTLFYRQRLFTLENCCGYIYIYIDIYLCIYMYMCVHMHIGYGMLSESKLALSNRPLPR